MQGVRGLAEISVQNRTRKTDELLRIYFRTSCYLPERWKINKNNPIKRNVIGAHRGAEEAWSDTWMHGILSRLAFPRDRQRNKNAFVNNPEVISIVHRTNLSIIHRHVIWKHFFFISK